MSEWSRRGTTCGYLEDLVVHVIHPEWATIGALEVGYLLVASYEASRVWSSMGKFWLPLRLLCTGELRKRLADAAGAVGDVKEQNLVGLARVVVAVISVA